LGGKADSDGTCAAPLCGAPPIPCANDRISEDVERDYDAVQVMAEPIISQLALRSYFQKPTHRARSNKPMQPTGWIGAILASRSSNNVFSIYYCGPFQPPADGQAVSPLV
jgi:hypothetical protein